MKSELWEAAMHLPSIRHFLGGIVRDVAEGRSTIVLLPPGMEPELVREAVHERLYAKCFRCETLDVTQHSAPPFSPMALATVLTIQPSEHPETYSDLMRLEQFPEVLQVIGLSSIAIKDRTAWLGLVRQWNEAARSLAEGPLLVRVICIVETADAIMDLLPSDDTHLSFRWWWGFPSAIELRLLCREMTNDDHVLAAWNECMVSGVAAGDITLADALLSSRPTTIEDVRGALKEFLHTSCPRAVMGENGDLLESRAYNDGLGDQPPARFRTAWATGSIIYSAEYGLEHHPTVLTCQQATADLLKHRLWRGQAEVLLHLADRTRLMVCLDLKRNYGKRWFERLRTAPNNDEERKRLENSSLDAELGFLVTLIQNGRIITRSWPWDAALNMSWIMRNQLAHYEPLDFDQFRAFWETVALGHS